MEHSDLPESLDGLVPPKAAHLWQKARATDHAPLILLDLLWRKALGQRLTRAIEANPELLERAEEHYRPVVDWNQHGFDLSSISGCEDAAGCLFLDIAAKHGWETARRIFEPMAKEIAPKAKQIANNTRLLFIYDLSPPLGRNIKQLARRVAAANKCAAAHGLSQSERLAGGSQDPEVITRRINRLLEDRRKKAKG
jgi:hypothetical protein